MIKNTNIRDTFCVVSTPVVDQPRGNVFVAARVLQGRRGASNIVSPLPALDVGTDKDTSEGPIDFYAEEEGIIPLWSSLEQAAELPRSSIRLVSRHFDSSI